MTSIRPPCPIFRFFHPTENIQAKDSPFGRFQADLPLQPHLCRLSVSSSGRRKKRPHELDLGHYLARRIEAPGHTDCRF